MDNEEIQGVKFSEFPSATPGDSDEVVGLHAGDNARFSVANFVLAIRQGLANIFVPLTRTINGKALNNDISLNASDVGAVATSAVGAVNGVASLDSAGKVPSSQLPSSTGPEPATATPLMDGTGAVGTSTKYAREDHEHPADTNKQDTITASGILKGDGQGGVTAATPGEDYATPAMIPTVPTAYTSNPAMDGTASPGSSGAWAKGDHVHPSDTTKANQSQLATEETGSTASKNYAVGECFCWNGLLYQATTTISTGQAFTPGTNCRQTTVCDKQGYRLLWTNSNPNASFSAATLANTGGFRRYHIVFRITSSSANYFDFVGLLDVGVYHAVTNITSPTSGVPVLSFRTVVKEASGNLTISNCDSRQVTATSRSQDNASIIPYQVFAIL